MLNFAVKVKICLINDVKRVKKVKNLNWQSTEKVCTCSQFPDKDYAVIIKVQIWR